MTTQYTITQAQGLTLETLDAMTLEQLQVVVEVLGTSEAKKARLKLDQVKAIIEKRKKEAKKAGAKEEQQELQLVENSVKKVTKPRKPKAVEAPEKEAEEEENDEAEMHQELVKLIDEATTVKELREFASEYNVEVPKAIKLAPLKALLKEELALETYTEDEAPKQQRKPKGSGAKKDDSAPSLADMQKQFLEMQKQMKALQTENEKLKAEKFPKEVETQKKGSKLVAIDFEKVPDVQKALVDNPYKVYMQIHEGLDATATTFVVVFMNEEKLVLVDKSRDINSVLDLEVKYMTPTTVQIDKRDCPYQFYMMTADKK